MKGNVKGRILAWVLTIMMVVSYTPQIAFATDTAVTPNTAQTEATHDHDHEATPAAETAGSSDASETESSGGEVVETEPTEPSEESTETETKEPVKEEQTRVEHVLELIEIVLDGFGITEDMSDDEIADAIQHAQVDNATGSAFNELLSYVDVVTDKEIEEAMSYDVAKTFTRFYSVMELMNTPMVAANLTKSPISGITVKTTSANSANEITGGYEFTAKGSKGNGCTSQDSSNTIKIEVSFDETVIDKRLEFTWNFSNSNGGSLSINGVTQTADKGTYVYDIASAGKFEISMTSPVGDKTCTLTLKDFVLSSTDGQYDVTVTWNKNLGNITAGGSSIPADGCIKAVSVKDGVQLVAVPNGANFVGWRDVTDANDSETYCKLLSASSTYTLKPERNMTVEAVFEKNNGNVWYGVDDEFLYDDFNLAKAKASNGSKIVVMNSGILTAGDYVVPEGITLLIPYDNANSVYREIPPSKEGYVKPTAYRLLTLADGANLIVDGEINVGAMHSASQGSNGCPTETYGQINLEGGSAISINSGGVMYAWGYITGEGNVIAKAGSKVYESFQMTDWRGGTWSALNLRSEPVFPMSQYYVQNIQAPMKLEAGAVEYGVCSIAVSDMENQTPSVPFIGKTEGLFRMTSDDGYIIKDYNEYSDRLEVEVHGNIEMAGISMSMKLPLVGNTTIDTKSYILGINHNITVDIKSGSNVSVNQDLSLLPGAKINIEKGATCSLTSGKSMYVYDADQWGPYTGSDNQVIKPVPYAIRPSAGILNRTPENLEDASICVNGTVDATNGYIYTTAPETNSESGYANIYSTEQGEIVCGKGTKSSIKQITQNNTFTGETFNVPVVPAQLKNADGTYKSIKIDSNDTSVRAYKFMNGKWHTIERMDAYDSTCEEPGLSEDCYMCLMCDTMEYYKDETYTEYTEGETPVMAPKGHDYHTEVVAPTCTKDGTSTQVCSRDSKHNVVTVLPATGHTPGAEATCTTPQLCTVCDAVLAEELGHDWAEPDCFTPQTCRRCGETEGKPLDHDIQLMDAKNPTCATEGNEEHYKCVLCGTCYIDANGDYEMPKDLVTIPALGHKGKKVAAVDATCTTAGNIEHYKCTVCDAFLADKEGTQELTEDQVVIKALNHDEVNHEAKAPTCTEYGWDAYVTCTRCDYTTYEKKAALGHDKVSHEAKAETCTEPGWKAYVACSRCDYSTKVEIPKLGHNEVNHEAKAPTCTEPGWEAYVTCTRCDYTTKVEIPELGHDKVQHEAKEETCEEPGWDAYESCSRCDYTTKVEIPELGHDEVNHEAKAVTCTEDGWDAYVTCNRCDYITKEVITALGHDEISHEAKDPTCTEIGWEPHLTCGRCDYTTIVEIPALGHKFTKVEAIKKTCTTDGRIEYYDCSVCGGLYTDEKGENKITQEETVVPASHELNETEIEEPTCTEMGYAARTTCKECDYVEESNLLEPLGHTAKEWNIDVPATCTKDGYKTAICDRCGDSMGEDIPATGHSIEAVEAAEPTCTATGNKAHYKCAACDELFLDADGNEKTTAKEITIAAKGHKAELVAAVEPTCTATGNEEHYKCTVCDELFLDAEAAEPTTIEEITIAANGHDTEAVEAKEPTCTEKGNKAYFECKVCDALTLDKEGKEPTTIEEITIAATGHNTELVEAKAAACTDGNKEHYKCTVCDKLFLDAAGETSTTIEEVTISGDGHKTEPVGAKEPTCTEAGNKEHYKCTVCDELFLDAEAAKPTTTEEMAIAATGHAAEFVEAKAATCTETGYEEHYKCPACGELFLDAEADIPVAMEDLTTAAKGHSAKLVGEAEPTCTEKGNKAHYKCTACEKLFEDKEATKPTTTDDVTIAATGHTTEAVDAKEPTCTEKGNKAHYQCTVCDELFLDKDAEKTTTADEITIAAKGHATAEVKAEAATCTETGIKTHYVCGTCGLLFADVNGRYTITAEDTIEPAKGHETDLVAAEAATCTEEGNIAYYECSVCDELFLDKAGKDATTIEEVTIAALGHDEVTHEAKAATCTEIGWDAYETCSRCDYTTYEEIDALGHDEIAHEAKAATCTEIGWDAYETCSRCDYKTKIEIGALGHDEVAQAAKAATCTEIGWDAHVACSRCDYTTKVEIDALGHNEVTHEAKAPTCTEIGWDEFVTCDRCDYSTYEAKEALDHLWNTDAETGGLVYTVDVAPKCTTIGYESVYCTRDNCGAAKDTREIPATGHSFGEWYETAPVSCNTDGGERRDCINCNYYETNILDMLGHDKVAYEGKDATCEEGGWLPYEKCSRCDWTSYKEIAPLGHAVKEHDAKKATCTEIGWEAYDECTVCDYTTYAEIKATGHTSIADAAVAPTCTEAGKTAGSHCLVCGEILEQQLAIDPTGHTSVITKAVAPTCTEAGKTAGISCSVCNEALVAQKPVAALGHTTVVDAAVAATCTTDGLTEGSHCEVCDEVFTAQETVKATGHEAVTDKAVAATCTADGLTEGSHCAVCGEVLKAQETVKATGHTAVTDKAVAPTCTEEGLTEGSHCETCGEVITAQETVAATGHSYGEWTVVEATCTEEGTKTKYCADCNDVVTETIEAPGHKYGEEQYQVPTEKEPGGHYKVCDVCEDMIWTAPQSYSDYVKAEVEATTLNVTATGSVKTETITVKWTNSSDAEIGYYKVYRSTTGKTGTFNYIGKASGKSYEDKKATVGKTYYYKVIGYAELDGETFKTKTSVAASAKIKKVTAAQVKATPMKATTNYVDRGLKLEWTSPNIKVDGYEIQRSTTKNGTYKVVETTKASTMSWTNKGLKAGKCYFFKVRGFKYVNGKKVYTKFSSKGYRYVLKGNDAKLAAAIVRADAITAKSAVKVSGGIKVTWSKKSSIKCNKYTVWRATSENGKYTKIATTKNKYYTDKKAKAGKTYYYKVKGQRKFGKSNAVTNYSNVVSGKR